MRAVLDGKVEKAQLTSVASFPRSERQVFEYCVGDCGRSEEESINIAQDV